MKNTFKKIAGATLLEVMLVLAIAAMIIVMSVRYYQSAQSNQQSNSLLSQVQGIVAAADQLAQGTGSYTGTTNATLQPLLPQNAFTAPWGSAMTVTAASATALTFSIAGMPPSVCLLVRGKLGNNNHFSGSTTAAAALAACPATPGTWTFNYISNI